MDYTASNYEQLDVLYSNRSLYQDDPYKQGMDSSKHHHQQQQQQESAILEFQVLDEGRFNMVLPQLRRFRKDSDEPKKEKNFLASFELLKSYGKGFNRLNRKRILEPSNGTSCLKEEFQELSTEEIIRIASARFIQSSTQVSDDIVSRTPAMDFNKLRVHQRQTQKEEK
ncbi:hypothetical protein K2173_022339 [Erythroxylum novogranatense]|uniref:Uncharacterized protein n=1 Tax=Erythroxylum novogranatense TaxID=1862640 RepID=A0AAV8TJ25_9ROSI|nr:hypothetical protein K2173_022339 [Erythroxylum novogranatense]